MRPPPRESARTHRAACGDRRGSGWSECAAESSWVRYVVNRALASPFRTLEVVELEALAHAAGEAITRLPRACDPTQRRDLTRIYALVSKVAADAAAAASHGDQLVAALSAYLDAQRTIPD